MYTLEKIKNDCNEIAEKLGITVDVPITLNKRLTFTLGRVLNGYRDGEYNPTAIEFSEEMLNTTSDSTIRSVIEHEMVHYYITSTTHERHGHDAFFKEICKRIGCKNDGCSTRVDRTVSPDAIYRYVIYCPTCNDNIGYYRRAGKTIKNIDNYHCTVCGNKGLKVIQNW